MAKKKQVPQISCPPTLPILGHDYKVLLEKTLGLDDDGSVMEGLSSPYEIKIALDSNKTLELQESTLLHEILHSILHVSGQSNMLSEKQEEALVVAFEHGLMPLYKRREQ